jgi:ATP-dependent helicase/nuclease subunit A
MWTKEQQNVIDARNRNLLVAAAAGSGKTAVLVERIIHMILDTSNPIDIDKFLIVTFTNAAASEMRERIGNAIEKEVIHNPDNVHLQKQLALIHKAQITTIHSFCLDIIKGHYNDIDLDPAFKIADENELVLIKTEILQDILEEKYNQADEAFIDFVECYSTGKTDNQIEELILKLNNFSQSYPYPKEWLESCKKFYEIKTIEDINKLPHIEFIVNYIRTIISDTKKILIGATEICKEDCSYFAAIQSDLENINAIENSKSFADLYRALNNISYEALSRKKDNVDKEVKEMIKSLRNSAKENINKIISDLLFQDPKDILEDIIKLRSIISTMVEITIQFQERFAKTKREKNLLDFGDLEHFALEILVGKDEITGEYIPNIVAKELRDHYVEIMIDEYQDSNLIQDTILTSISRAVLGEPNIFMVGDVKQSIYKFRLARPELFIDKYNTYSQDESKYQRIELHKNFRSRQEVLNVTNFIFLQIMRSELGDIEYNDNVALNVGAEFLEESTTNRNVELILVEKRVVEENEEDKQTNFDEDEEEATSKELEARAIAKKINELINNDKPYLVVDSITKEYRPARYNDIVILLRSISGWTETFVDVLSEEGIPAYADTSAGYFSTVEIRTILSYLTIIDNPRQDIPLCAVLHSPIIDLTTEELAIIKLADRTASLYDALIKYSNLEEKNDIIIKVNRFVEQLNKFREKSTYLSIHQLIYYILDETGYYDYATAMPAGLQRKANIDMLISKAIGYENTGFKGLFKFIKYIEKIKKYEIDFGEASTITEKDNTVRLMSVHKSKGLEFPIVVVAGMGKQFNNLDARDKTLVHPDFGLGVDLIDPKKRLKSPTIFKRIISKKIMLENLGEELRILYVALTRAKEKLIITGYTPSAEMLIKKSVTACMSSEIKLSFSGLSSSRTYLDWIVPSLIRNKCFAHILNEYEIDIDNNSCNQFDNVPIDIRIINADDLIVLAAAKEIENTAIMNELINWDKNLVFNKEIKNKIDEALNWEYEYKDEVSTSIKVTVTELKRLGENAEESDQIVEAFKEDTKMKEEKHTIPRFRQEKTKVENTRYGTVIHKLFEKIPIDKMISEESVANEIAELCRQGFFTAEEASSVKPDIFVNFHNTDLAKNMQKACDDRKLFKERPFVLGIPAKEIFESSKSEELTMIQGVIDAYYEENGELVIVDYKTDKASRDEILNRYSNQLRYYKMALEQITVKKVVKTVIYSTYLKEEIVTSA